MSENSLKYGEMRMRAEEGLLSNSRVGSKEGMSMRSEMKSEMRRRGCCGSDGRGSADPTELLCRALEEFIRAPLTAWDIGEVHRERSAGVRRAGQTKRRKNMLATAFCSHFGKILRTPWATRE